jgi:hypothetical protein
MLTITHRLLGQRCLARLTDGNSLVYAYFIDVAYTPFIFADIHAITGWWPPAARIMIVNEQNGTHHLVTERRG